MKKQMTTEEKLDIAVKWLLAERRQLWLVGHETKFKKIQDLLTEIEVDK